MIYAIGDICPRLFTLIVFPVLTSNLIPAEYGIINYVNTIDVFLSVFCILGMNTYFMVYFYKMRTDDEKKKLMGNISLYMILNTIIISTFLYLLGPYLFRSWGCQVNFFPYISLGILTNLFNVLSVMPSCLFRVLENPLPLTIINVAKGFITMILTMIVVTCANGDAYSVLMIRCVVSAVLAFVYLFITYKHVSFNFDFSGLSHVLKFSIPLVPGSIAYYLFSLSDRLLVEKYLTLSELGIYSTAATLAMLLNIVSNGAYKAFEPYFFQTYGTASFKSRFVKVRDVYLYVVLIVGAGLSLFSQDFLNIFSSEQYHTAYKYVPLLTIGTICSAISLMYSTILIAREKTAISTCITFLSAVSSIIINVVFLKKIGLYAAAIAFDFSFAILLMMNVIYSKIKAPFIRPMLASIITILIFVCGSYYCSNICIKVLCLLLIFILNTFLLKINYKEIIPIFKK